MLTSWTCDPASLCWSLFITLVIRGQESGHRVKMNEPTQTRSARSSWVTVRPDRSTRRKFPSSIARSPRSWAARGEDCPARAAISDRIADARIVLTTTRMPHLYDRETLMAAAGTRPAQWSSMLESNAPGDPPRDQPAAVVRFLTR